MLLLEKYLKFLKNETVIEYTLNIKNKDQQIKKILIVRDIVFFILHLTKVEGLDSKSAALNLYCQTIS